MPADQVGGTAADSGERGGQQRLPHPRPQELAIARYIRWANRHATPKRHYTVNSKIRRPDYLPNVA
jgi:hypothetical protein